MFDQSQAILDIFWSFNFMYDLLYCSRHAEKVANLKKAFWLELHYMYMYILHE